MPFTVAIVGRPNVGKSTLFNRLTGRRAAIVHDRPGVTRDRREGEGAIGDMRFRLIDTAGLEDAAHDTLEARMRAQTERAVQEADVVLFLIDARAGVLPVDEHFAESLRRAPAPVVLVANKCEGRAGRPGLLEAYALGLGDPVPLSAEHGEGLDALYEALSPFARRLGGFDAPPDDGGSAELPDDDALEAAARHGASGEGDEDGEDDENAPDIDPTSRARDDPARPVQVAIVGRPNVGKSTLVNRLLGEDRLLTGPEAGVTRDAITVDWTWKGRRFRLVDTAGLRRRGRITDSLERLSAADTLEALRMAQVVVLVVDADAVLDKQDLTIARHVVEEGRALVVAVNKWDAAKDRAAALKRLNDRLETSLAQARGVPTVTLSALTGKGLDRLMDAVLSVYAIWNRRIPTGKLNRWLAEITSHHPPPLGHHGRRVRLRYMTQAKTRPPTFVVFASVPDDLPDSYVRYLTNALREDFDLPGTPLRLLLRKPKNPYADKPGV